MKTIFAALVLALCFPVLSPGMARLHPPSVTLDGRLNCPYISYHGGSAYLQLTITTPNLDSPKRRPMNLSIVLDRSGSMGDDRKIENAKQAVYSLIDQLTSEDILSIVIYDDVIQVLRSAQRVGDKRELKRLVERIYPRGSTNLGGGMVEGFRQAEKNVSKEFVNRVVLLSDGLANQGVTDPSELNRIARRYRSKSISLTTMGVGLDYNENLMVGLSENGGGNYYFIETPSSLASIMRKEFNLLSSLVAHNATIEITLGKNVRVNDVIGCEYRAETNRYVVPVGDLYANERRELTIELLIPPGEGTVTVASGTLRYDSDSQWPAYPAFSTSVTYTKDLAEVEKKRDLETQAKADVAVSTRKVEQAMKALDEGRAKEATQQLYEAKSALGASPAASYSGSAGSALREQVSKLGAFEDMVKDSSGDARKAKKSIQYENYKTQKSKQ